MPDIPLEEKCPQCGRNMVLRHGRYGEFISCSGYPECKYIKQNFIGVKCPQCADGELVEKKARRARQYVLRLLELSELRFHFGLQAGGGGVPAVWQPVPAGEAFKVRVGAGLPEQRA